MFKFQKFWKKCFLFVILREIRLFRLNAFVGTFLGSIPASSHSVESDAWAADEAVFSNVHKREKSKKIPLFK